MNKDNNTDKNFVLADRIKDYLVGYMDDYIFDQLTDEYLEKIGMADILKSVYVPFKKTELNDLSGINLARSMAYVIGCDPDFEYEPAYKEFINRAFGGEFVKPLMGEGITLAEKGEFEKACICFRAAMVLDPEESDAIYCYARACKDCYETGEGEEYVGRFKAESLEALERLTIIKPDFEMGYYYLGYAYLNLGLYLKAQLTFKRFMELTDEEHLDLAMASIPKDAPISKEELRENWKTLREEVVAWIEKLAEPIKIESAYNEVLAGRYDKGIELLEPYTEDEAYNKWWPLFFYLGISYEQLGDLEKAEQAYKKVLEFSPSNIDAMEGLVRIGEEKHDENLVSKYQEKIKVVNKNREEERAEKNKEYH